MSADLLLLVARGMIAASAAIALVLALRGWARSVFGARVAYGFWLLVPAAAIASYLPARVVHLPGQSDAIAASATASDAIAVAPAVADVAAVSTALPDIAAIALFVWLSGVVFSVLLVTLDQSRALSRLKLRRDGHIYRADCGSIGPAVVGVFAPRVVVPSDFEQRYSETERTLVLAHEHAHLHARDAQINGLAALAQCLNWFNPLFYWARAALRVDQELACDERVMASHASERRTYAEAMLKTQLAARAIPLGCQWPALGAQPLKERITMLRRPNTTPAMRALGVISCLALIGGAGLAAWAAQPPQFAYAAGFDSDDDNDRGTTREQLGLGARLLDALQNGDMSEARALIAAGADVNYFRRGDGTPLIMAVRQSDERMVDALIGAGANVNQGAPGDGNALIAASGMGDMDLVRRLVEAGADVNGYVRGDETPLINAARENQLAAASYLIERGADVNLEVEAPTINSLTERRSPMSVARDGDHAAMIQLLRQSGARG
jgi:beta-lactamase regulating signal transducer with metallopeptidase domain